MWDKGWVTTNLQRGGAGCESCDRGWPRNNQKPKTTGKMKFKKKSESVVGENQNHQTPWEHEVEVSPGESSPKPPGDPSPHSRPQDGMQKCGEGARVPWAASHSWARAPGAALAGLHRRRAQTVKHPDCGHVHPSPRAPRAPEKTHQGRTWRTPA